MDLDSLREIEIDPVAPWGKCPGCDLKRERMADERIGMARPVEQCSEPLGTPPIEVAVAKWRRFEHWVEIAVEAVDDRWIDGAPNDAIASRLQFEEHIRVIRRIHAAAAGRVIEGSSTAAL